MLQRLISSSESSGKLEGSTKAASKLRRNSSPGRSNLAPIASEPRGSLSFSRSGTETSRSFARSFKAALRFAFASALGSSELREESVHSACGFLFDFFERGGTSLTDDVECLGAGSLKRSRRLRGRERARGVVSLEEVAIPAHQEGWAARARCARCVRNSARTSGQPIPIASHAPHAPCARPRRARRGLSRCRGRAARSRDLIVQ